MVVMVVVVFMNEWNVQLSEMHVYVK